jgi:FkbM family methyltransferase
MIEMKQIDGNSIDLSNSVAFVEHYNKPNSFAKQIIEKEINAGLWYDDILFNLPNDSVIIDAGANVGLFSLYMLPRIKKVYCIEPSHVKTLYSILLKLANSFYISESALFNYDGWCSLFSNEINSTMNNVVSKKGDTLCHTLKTFTNENKIESVNLLKLDIEGGEQQVIMEDETIGEALSICKNVFIEVHPIPYGNADEQGIINKMISFGFNHKKGARELSHYFTR